MKPRIAITIGDFNGIGPEVVIKCLANAALMKTVDPILVGSAEVFVATAKRLKIKKRFSIVQTASQKVPAGSIPVLNVFTATEKNIQYGVLAPDAGVCCGVHGFQLQPFLGRVQLGENRLRPRAPAVG